MISGRNARHPFRRRRRLPPVFQHIQDGIDKLIAKATRVFVIRDQLPPTRIAPPRKNPSHFRVEHTRERSLETVLGECILYDPFVAVQSQFRLTKKTSCDYHSFACEERLDDWSVEAWSAFSTWLGIRIVERLRKEFHQASFFVDIFLNLPPFGLSLSGQATDLLDVHPIRHRRTLPLDSRFDDRSGIVHRQELENFLDLSASQIDFFLKLNDTQSIALIQNFECRRHPILSWKGASSEVFMNVVVLIPRHQNADSMADAAAKQRFGYAKVRYRGLAKNRQRIALLLGFANLMIGKRHLALA